MGVTTVYALDEFVAFATSAYQEKTLPDDVRHAALAQVVDSVGVAMAATHEESVQAVRNLVAEWGSSGSSRAYGSDRGVHPAAAALINGTMAHALDFDDIHGPSVLHPSASVVSAVLAVGQAVGATMDDVMRAVALGNELVVRLGMAGTSDRDSIFFERGFHATSICGAVGSALACGLISGSAPEKIADAVAIACSFGSGVIEANRTGGTVKRLHCGWAAFSAVNAMDLARLGISGPRTVFEGRFGFLRAFCGEDARPEWVTRDLGSHWEIQQIGFKPYPANGFTHSAIDAALELRNRGVGPGDVESIELGLPAPVLRTVAEPREVKIRPTSSYSARFSAPWVFALALRGGGGLGVAIDDFSAESLGDSGLRGLAERVDVHADEWCSAAFPQDLPARVRATVSGGAVEEVEVPHRRGSPRNPLTPEEIQVKFISNATRAIDADRAERLYDLLSSGGERAADVISQTRRGDAEA